MSELNPNVDFEGQSGILLKIPARCLDFARFAVGFTAEIVRTVPEMLHHDTRLIPIPLPVIRKK